ncbi:FAD-dependent monooxygenase [Plantactinospora siamensis]|uniref:FAD-dependent monooxygenase n=1 Tax=Plantactinospora siamensis TaxID=555372 RepID=A0ABV6P6H4_9ACTN
MMNRTVLISGASVAGPALAYWLHRQGFAPTVVERAPQLRGGGYAVDFRGHVHLSVLRQMGILDELRANETQLRTMSYVDGDGRRVAGMPAYIFAGDIEIRRGDLAKVLYDATRGSAEYLFDDTITALRQDADGVDVTFANRPPRRFDLVIGADGAHSIVRRLAFPGARVEEAGLYGAVFSTTNFLGLDREAHLYNEPGRMASIFSVRGATTAMLSLNSPEPIAYDHHDVEQQRRIVEERFAGAGWHVPELLRQMRTAPDFYFDSSRQIHLDRWSTGRIALAGDAGYGAGPGGNGTGTAVVAAYVLAGELARADGDHTVAFERYERLLRGLVAAGQKQAAGGAGMLAPATWRAIHWRNRFFRVLPYLPTKGMIKKMATKTAVAIDLPTYPLPAAR